MTIRELALNWIENSNEEVTAITREQAEEYIGWMDPDTLENLDEEMTADAFMEAWNDIVEESEKRMGERKLRGMKDGWHEIMGYRVWVEDGMILRGMKKDYNNSWIACYVYRESRRGGFDKEEKITVDAFRAGVRRGTIWMK